MGGVPLDEGEHQASTVSYDLIGDQLGAGLDGCVHVTRDRRGRVEGGEVYVPSQEDEVVDGRLQLGEGLRDEGLVDTGADLEGVEVPALDARSLDRVELLNVETRKLGLGHLDGVDVGDARLRADRLVGDHLVYKNPTNK